jgi:ribonuclease HI
MRLIRAPDGPDARGSAVTIHSDSELLVRQLTGQYQVKSATLAPLFHQVQTLLLKLGRWTIRHVPREENQRADQLANLAMDQRRDVVVVISPTAGVA